MKTTAEMIEVMAAFERGEEIEYQPRNSTEWCCITCTPLWDWPNTDYRIKPREPRVIWVNEYAHEAGVYAYESEDAAKSSVSRRATRTAVKYVEAIE